MRPDKYFDVIIVGAGAAGCVLAGRLSEASDKEILLIEAGPDAPAEREHADIRHPYPIALGNPRFSWPRLVAEVGADPGGGRPRASRDYLQGYGVGGGSNIQGMIALRGQPEDYDEWRDHGVTGWGWKEVLPYFRKLERDLDFSGPLHGDAGPMPVRRVPASQWAPFSKAFGAAVQRRGYPLVEDYNVDFSEGISPIPMSNLPDRRVSASMAYLTTAVRQRANLTILPDAFVELLDIRAGRVCGVVVRTAAGPRRICGRETIVSCGALQSPAMLMRSGIGPGEHLRAMGVKVIRDLDGVGRNLQNHPKIDVAVHLPRAAVQPREQQAFGQNCWHYSSRVQGCPPGDICLISINKTAWHALGRRIGALAVAIHKPFSQGCVELASADPAIAPRVRFDLLSDARDFERLVGGLRTVLELLADKEIGAVRNEAFLPQGKIVSRLNRRNRWNGLQAWAIASVLDIPLLRKALLKKMTLDIGALMKDENALREMVRRRAQLSHHVSGTCRMGSASDPRAVLDSNCRVRGIDGLRVVDASIFPTLMRANTHLPVLMAAEKMADHIKADWTGVDALQQRSTVFETQRGSLT